MNPMYEFTDSEIGLLDMALQVIADRIEMAREHEAVSSKIVSNPDLPLNEYN